MSANFLGFCFEFFFFNALVFLSLKFCFQQSTKVGHLFYFITCFGTPEKSPSTLNQQTERLGHVKNMTKAGE